MAGASTLKAYFQSRRRLEQKLEAAQAEAALQEAVSARQTDEIVGLLGQCEELEERLVKMQRSERDLLDKIRQLAKRGNTLETALRATAPQCRTAGDQKAFYAQVAPALDENGFQLYWTAKEITGIDVRNEFPYEDSLGRFAEADGNVPDAVPGAAVFWRCGLGSCWCNIRKSYSGYGGYHHRGLPGL